MTKQLGISEGVEFLFSRVGDFARSLNHKTIGLYHFLYLFFKDYSGLITHLVPGIDIEKELKKIEKKLKAGKIGPEITKDNLLLEVQENAQKRKRKKIFEKDVAIVILEKSGFNINPFLNSSTNVKSTKTHKSIAENQSNKKALNKQEESGEVFSYRPLVRDKSLKYLIKFGKDLTYEAFSGKLGPIIGRDKEIELIIETLCRRTKRNPLLIGPAGVGKTAVVEGVAIRIVKGQVPEFLKNYRIFALSLMSLMSGASRMGELEERMNHLLNEAKQEGIILFIDEIHTVVGSGGIMGLTDIASFLKPELARGSLLCIGATTDEEYRRYIAKDKALERRFQPVRIQELSENATLQILQAYQKHFLTKEKIVITDKELQLIIFLSGQYLRNRHFPDKAIDILEQCVAYVKANDEKEITTQIVENVTKRMVGVPLNWKENLNKLEEELVRGGIEKSKVENLCQRLSVTMEGMDIHPQRPNAVLLFINSDGSIDFIAQSIAKILFEDPRRVIDIDLTSYHHPADINRLIGSGPGYVGYGEATPLHQISQMPWSILIFRNIHACHPYIRETILQALMKGYFLDGTGRRIFLSDTIVLLTIQLEANLKKLTIGFQNKSNEELDWRKEIEQNFGYSLSSIPDVIITPIRKDDEYLKYWLREEVLQKIIIQYKKLGIEFMWDESVLNWLITFKGECKTSFDWEKVVETHLLQPLVQFIQQNSINTGGPHGSKTFLLTISYQDGNVLINSKN